MKKIATITAAATIFAATQANAAGYQLNEMSTTGLGRSFAGIGVMGDDYSAMAYNPAGMTLVKRSGVQAGLALTEIASKAKSKYGTDKMDYFVPLPSLLSQYNLNNKWFFGAGIYVPYGLSTKYKHDSHVAQNPNGQGVRKSFLEVIDFNISSAYLFDNGLSLGASAILRYIRGQLTANVNNYKGYPTPNIAYSDFNVHGWSNTWQLGAMYEFSENTRIGLSYRFKSTQKPKGKQYITYNQDYAQMAQYAFGVTLPEGTQKYHTFADPELPASWILSGFHKWNDKWGTSATVKYIQWHRFYTFPAQSTAPGGNYDVDYKWKDAWTISLGQEYYANENWTLRAGTAWDQSPSAGNTHRTNRIPDTDRIWLSAGASYMTGNHQFDLGYAHLFMMHGRSRGVSDNDLDVKYHNHSNMFAFQYQYKF